MAVIDKSKLMEQLKTFIGDNTSDEALSFVEDVADTYDDLQNKANGDGEDWKKKFEENDAEWRQRYRDRFFEGSPDGTGDGKPENHTKTEPEPDADNEHENLKYEDLFNPDNGKE